MLAPPGGRLCEVDSAHVADPVRHCGVYDATHRRGDKKRNGPPPRPVQSTLSERVVALYDRVMGLATFRVSDRGQMALPVAVRRRWHLTDGGSVEIADLGDALVIVPSDRGGLRAMLAKAIEEAGGYAELAQQVAQDDPDLA